MIPNFIDLVKYLAKNNDYIPKPEMTLIQYIEQRNKNKSYKYLHNNSNKNSSFNENNNNSSILNNKNSNSNLINHHPLRMIFPIIKK